MGNWIKRAWRHFLVVALAAAAWPALAGPGDIQQAAQAAQAGTSPGAAASTEPLGIALLGAGLFMFWLYARRKQNRS